MSFLDQSAAAVQRASERVQAGDLTGATDICRASVSSGNRDFNTLFMLGSLESHFGNFEDAERHLSGAIALNPRSPEALITYGNVLLELNRPSEAADILEKGLALRPGEVTGLIYRGLASVELGNDKEALEYFDRALRVSPHELNALHNHANVLIRLGLYGEARRSVEAVLQIAPGHVLAIINRAIILSAENKCAAALAETDRALAIEPDCVGARLTRGDLRLSIGDFIGGWSDNLERDSMELVKTRVDRTPFPEDLHGRRILILSDQGLGDEIFFLRFAGALKERGATTLYRASERISAMIARASIVDHVVDLAPPPIEPSVTVSVGDLPYLLNMSSAAEIPPSLVLPPLPEAQAKMAERLRALGPGPYVGVTWRAGTKDGLFKEVPREAFAETLKHVPGNLVALQRLPLDGEVEAFGVKAGRPVHDLTDLNDSLEDMLAALALIDEYVCVSNTNLHLRAGTGRTCRVLMPSPPEFRWMAEGRESPWFPGSNIYRQAPNGDWRAALAALKADLS
jgi:tetratricopeptide (TPR) repeat protein